MRRHRSPVGRTMAHKITRDIAARRGMLLRKRALFRHCRKHSGGLDDHSRDPQHDTSMTALDSARIIELHKLLADWGEGTSQATGEEGHGAPATPMMPPGGTVSLT